MITFVWFPIPKHPNTKNPKHQIEQRCLKWKWTSTPSSKCVLGAQVSTNLHSKSSSWNFKTLCPYTGFSRFLKVERAFFMAKSIWVLSWSSLAVPKLAESLNRALLILFEWCYIYYLHLLYTFIVHTYYASLSILCADLCYTFSGSREFARFFFN